MVGSGNESVYRIYDGEEEDKNKKPTCMPLGEAIEDGFRDQGVKLIVARKSMSQVRPDLYYTIKANPNVPVETEMVEIHSPGCTTVDVEKRNRRVIGECSEAASEQCDNCIFNVAEYNETAEYILGVVGVRSYDDDGSCF